MKHGKWLRIAVLVAVFALVAAACGDDDEGGGGDGEISGTLVFFAYEDSFLPAVMEPFQAAYPDLNVEMPAFSDEEETETKLRAGFEADVVEMCAGEIGGMVENGLLQSIDTSRIDDWDKIFPLFLNGKGTFDEDGNVYMVPLQGGSAGIVYDTDAIPGGIASYEEMFITGTYDGYIAIDDNYTNSIGDALMALGYGPEIFEATEAQVAEAVDLLIGLKQSGKIRTLHDSDSEIVNLLATGEVVAVAHGFSSLVATLDSEGVNVAYVAPAEGEVSWNCGHGIAVDSKNVDNAYALINHYMSVESQVSFAEEEEYLASNSRVLEEADPEIVAAYGLGAPGNAFTGTIYEGEPELDEVWLDEWRRFQSS
jgi:spermidine/putrescine transport system substrate-binding protein